MWWLNSGHRQFPSAPEESFLALEAGATNLIRVDPGHDMVVVTRRI